MQHLFVFNNISYLTNNFCLRRSFTFSSIALPLLYKDFSNEDNNLFMDNFQLQPLNSLDSCFINAICQSVFRKLQKIESKGLSDHFKTFEIMNLSGLDDIKVFLLNSLFKEIFINIHMCQPYTGDVDESTILQIVNSENQELNWILPTVFM